MSFDAANVSEESRREPRAPRGDRGLRVMPPEPFVEPPNSAQAEICLIACALQDSTVIARARKSLLLPRHFFHPGRAAIWEKICAAYDRTGSTGIEMVSAELELAGELLRLLPMLSEISGKLVNAPLEAGRHLQIVLDYAMVRQALGESARATSALQGWTGEELDAMFGAFALQFQRLSDFALRRKRPGQREIALAAEAYAEAAAAGTLDKSRSIPFGGLPDTTSKFLPFDVAEEDWLILVAAAPNGGKSTVLRQHVGNNLVHGKKFVVFLLETSKRRWLLALAAMFAGINIREIEDVAKLQPDRFANLRAWQQCITSWMDERLWIFDDVFFLEDIERTTREINRQVRDRQLAAGVPDAQAFGLDGVLGDHLHLVQTRREFRNQRDAQLSYIGSTLKILHKGLDVPGFWAAQLNRAARVEARRPKASELRDSGTLEANADAVLLLHTPPQNKAGQPQDGSQSVVEVELIQGKRRNGPAGICVDLFFHAKLGYYEEVVKAGGARPGQPKPKGGYKRGEA